MTRIDSLVMHTLMAVVLVTQAVRIGLAVATDDWSHLGDVFIISLLAATVMIRTATLRRLALRDQ